MSVYFIVQISMKDNGIYQKYLEECDDVFAQYNGRYLAVDDKFDLIEGESGYSKVVIISFEDKDDFDRWYYSEDYQRIVKYRLAGAKCDSVLVHGK